MHFVHDNVNFNVIICEWLIKTVSEQLNRVTHNILHQIYMNVLMTECIDVDRINALWWLRLFGHFYKGGKFICVYVVIDSLLLHQRDDLTSKQANKQKQKNEVILFYFFINSQANEERATEFVVNLLSLCVIVSISLINLLCLNCHLTSFGTFHLQTSIGN